MEGHENHDEAHRSQFSPCMGTGVEIDFWIVHIVVQWEHKSRIMGYLIYSVHTGWCNALITKRLKSQKVLEVLDL